MGKEIKILIQINTERPYKVIDKILSATNKDPLIGINSSRQLIVSLNRSDFEDREEFEQTIDDIERAISPYSYISEIKSVDT